MAGRRRIVRSGNTRVQNALLRIGIALERVANAADRDAPGITCEGICRGREHGARYEVPGLGQLYFWEQEVYLQNNYGQKADITLIPGLDRVKRSLAAYHERENDAHRGAERKAKERVLCEIATGVANWRPRVLAEHLLREQADCERHPDGSRDVDGIDEWQM